MKITQRWFLPALLVCAVHPGIASAKGPRPQNGKAPAAESPAPEAPGPAATEPAPPPPPEPAPGIDPDRDALRKRCEEAAKLGEAPEECKSLELEVVFQGGVAPVPYYGAPRTVIQARDGEAEEVEQQKVAEEQAAPAPGVTTAQNGEPDRLLELWAEARRQPPLFESRTKRFFSVGVRGGYPFIVARGAGLKSAYDPIVHVSAEAAYQLLSFVQIAIVGDFQWLHGDSAASKEYATWTQTTPVYEDGSSRAARDVGIVLDNRTDVGVRPTLRFNGAWRSVQASLGLGLGWHYMRASGAWRTKVGQGDRNGTNEIVQDAIWSGDDFAVYSFEERDHGAYAAFELAIMYRLLEERLGVGVMMQYSLLMHGAAQPDVRVVEDYGLGDELDGYAAEPDDYEETLVRHLNDLSFLSLGVAADYRF